MTISFTPKKVCKTPHSFSIIVRFEDHNGDQHMSRELGLFNNKGKSIRPDFMDLYEAIKVLESIQSSENMELVSEHNLPWYCNEEGEYLYMYEYEVFYTDGEFKTYPVVLNS